MVKDFVTDQFPDQNEGLQAFPEQICYRNCIVIGNIPMHMNLDSLFSLLQDAFLWKMNSKVISDLIHTHMKAVIFVYENEMVARLSAFHVRKAVENSNFALYDGNSLFLYCQQLDPECDPRSRNVTISGFDARIPKDIYLDLFHSFGTLRYYEFCTEGEISKARIEYDRVTSAFAAVLSLKGTLDRDVIVTLEIPLFQVPLMCPGSGRPQMVLNTRVLQPPQYMEAVSSPDEIRERYFMCFMNTSNYPTPEESWMDWNYMGGRGYEYPRGTFEECVMGSVSLEICRRKIGENSNFRCIPSGVYDSSDRAKEETLRLLFLQASKQSSWTLNIPTTKKCSRHL